MDIKAVIKEKGYTIEQVAIKMGVTRVTLSQTLSGNPSLSTLRRIAEALDCTMGDFFSDEITNKGNTCTCPHCGKSINIVLK